MKKILFLVLSMVLLLASCENNPSEDKDRAEDPLEILYGPNVERTSPSKIVVTPASAKPGDIVTITGEGFLLPDNMKWEAEHPDAQDYDNHASLGGNLVLFNVGLEEFFIKDVLNRLFHVTGTKAVEFISFEKNKIVCKVPEGAKTGRILVLGDKNDLIVSHVEGDKSNDFITGDPTPSEKEFIVLDATDDTK